MQYNEEGLCTSQVALLNNSVIESSFMLYDGDKIISYDSILQKDKTRYIHYLSDNAIDEMYEEIIFENNRKLMFPDKQLPRSMFFSRD